MEDRSTRAETVKPLDDEHCQCQFVRDSALSVKSDVNDMELNGETDDQDKDGGRREWI